MLRHAMRARSVMVLLALLAGAPHAARAQERPNGGSSGEPRREAVSYGSFADNAAAETSLLDETFRIDIQAITVTFDYYPDLGFVDAVARVDFVMRPGQSVPRIHFPPAERNAGIVRSFVLDGEAIAFPGPAVTSVRVAGSSQTIFEINRHLAPGLVHTLTLAYRLARPAGYPRFSTEVNDMAGHGNEELYPTLNTPHELARHRCALRVHGPWAYRCIGSGLVLRQDGEDADVQQWLQDSEREVASYTMMFVLMPAADTDLQERVVDGIPVRILAMVNGGVSIPAAFATLQDFLPKLRAAFGSYPAPRGLSIFLVLTGGGMEYFGGTISSPDAVSHEVMHGYFACATVMRTYRDSWLDEAITSWFDDVAIGATVPAQVDSYTGNWVGARSPVSVGYSGLAYSDGAYIIQAMAGRLGGVDRMKAFLRYVHERYAFKPFTTMDFVGYFRDYSGIDLKAQFERWLYNGASQPASGAAAARAAGTIGATAPGVPAGYKGGM